MISFLGALVALGLLAGSTGETPLEASAFSSYADGMQFRVVLTEEKLRSAPPWRRTDKNPPLSARAALAAASRQLATLIKNHEEWKSTVIGLESPTRDDRWIYVVSFEGPPYTRWPGDDRLQTLRLVVLMNGRAVEPSIRPLFGESGSLRVDWQDVDLETRCDAFDRLGSAMARQKHIPGTDFVLSLLEQRLGSGPLAAPGKLVEIHYHASVINHPELPAVEGDLTFRLETGNLGKGIQTATASMQAGGRRKVIMREEVAAGIRESWKDLPAESQISVTIDLLRVAG